jgi:hypothetical protein
MVGIRARLRLGACAVPIALYLSAAGATRYSGSEQLATPERTPLIALQREAVNRLKEATRSDVSAEDSGRSLKEASQRFDALAAEPDVGQADAAAQRAPQLPPDMRVELRRAARELAAAAERQTGLQGGQAHAIVEGGSPPARLDPSPYLALLERVRAQLAGEVALA